MAIIRALLSVLLLVLSPPVLAAESVPWTPPRVGTEVAYEMTTGTIVASGKAIVVAVEGDYVTTSNTIGGERTQETTFRGLLTVVTSSGSSYEFDQAPLRALWPLEAGKSAKVSGVTVRGQAYVAFAAHATVEAFETLHTPAGSFRTARVASRVEVGTGGQAVALDVLQWMDSASGLMVKNEMVVYVGSKRVQSFSLVAVRGPTPP